MDQPTPTPTHIRAGPTIGIPSKLLTIDRLVGSKEPQSLGFSYSPIIGCMARLPQPAFKGWNPPEKRTRRGRPRIPGMNEAILDTTIALAAEEGFAMLTLEMIAARVGVARPTIYRRWPTKEALFADALAKIIDDFKHQETGDIRTDLILYVTEMIKSIQSPAGTVYLAHTFEKNLSHLGEEARRRGRAKERQIIERALEKGQLAQDTDPDLLLDLLLGIVWYRGHVELQHMDESLAEAIVDRVLPSFLPTTDSRRRKRQMSQLNEGVRVAQKDSGSD